MRELVRDANDFLQALGHATDARQEYLVFEDRGSLTKSRQTVVAGRATAITSEEIGGLQPNFVVVDDHTPQSQIDRLRPICEATRSRPELTTFSQFIDRLWQADVAAQWARGNSEAAEDTSLPPSMMRKARPDPGASYISQDLQEEGGDETHRALRFASEWVGGGDRALVVLADAGLGKSELTRVLQWRTALDYTNRTQDGPVVSLPPVALRLRLRDLATLSLEAIADHLRTTLRLERIRNTQVLVHLLHNRRLVLLLDGLDELSTGRVDLSEGLREINGVVEGGARIMVTCRSGYNRSEGPLRTELSSGSFLQLRPLSESGAIELLQRLGGRVQEARRIWSVLPEAVRGVPLFLIWALDSGYGRYRATDRRPTPSRHGGCFMPSGRGTRAACRRHANAVAA